MTRTVRLAAALLFLLAACQGPEQLVLKKYFSAVQFKDKATLASIAVEPTMPNLTKWEIVSPGEITTQVAPLKALQQAADEAKAKLEVLKGKAREAQAAMDAAKATLESASKKEKAAAQSDFDVKQTAYDQAVQAVKDQQKVLNIAKSEADAERKITALSASDLPGLETMDGEYRSKEVVVKLTIKKEDDTEEAKNYVVRMRSYKMVNPTTGRASRGKWIIMHMQPQGT